MVANTVANYWTFADGSPTQAYTYNNANSPTICYPAAGRYATKLVVKNIFFYREQDGTIDNYHPSFYQDSVTHCINVVSKPAIVAAAAQYPTLQYPDTLHLRACTSASYYAWQPAVGLSCTDCANPILSPPYSSAYSCVSWNTEGCTDTCRYTVGIDYGAREAYIPNAFTPNGDGRNDYFTAYGGVSLTRILRLQIFDRYGEFVFAKFDFAPNDDHTGWDGSFRGQPVGNDVFVYLIEVAFADGTTQTLTGDVTVVR